MEPLVLPIDQSPILNTRGELQGTTTEAETPAVVTPTPPSPVKFVPRNDQVLVKLDVKQPLTEVEKNARRVTSKPTVLPSGVIVEVGEGVFIGSGWCGSKFKPGDHVAIDFHQHFKALPLTANPDDFFVSISESSILGLLEGATQESAWFRKSDDVDKKEGVLSNRPSLITPATRQI